MAKAIQICLSHSPKKEKQGTIRVNLVEQEKGFLVLSDSGPSEAMDVSLDSSPNTVDLYMVEAGGLRLKGARSPPEWPLNLLFLL